MQQCEPQGYIRPPSARIPGQVEACLDAGGGSVLPPQAQALQVAPHGRLHCHGRRPQPQEAASLQGTSAAGLGSDNCGSHPQEVAPRTWRPKKPHQR